ncbi:MAG: ISL3 family transposase [Ferrovum sp.]|jgi:transposase|uniref:ISL3 family transposase n=1 Tax=Ferrovum sp. TaxID=2609467 RepID=UPI00262F6066|nr:ISL3 family transposase [Ferrovum sp.]MBW8067787.1 ISL3 family transposase [Ferrovum sp.]
MPTNILNLPAYNITAFEENDHDYHVSAETVTIPALCPHCRSDNLVGFGRREQMVRDLPMHGKRVGLYIDTRRYRCRACTKTFYETLPEVDEKRLMTKRLTGWMGKQSIKRTFASIAEEVGCTEFTVRSVFSDYVNELEKTIRFETPKWMGIDEIHLIKPRGVIANIQDNTIVELLPNRNKDTVVRYLSRLDGRDRIQYVAMDMWQPCRDACQFVIPQAQVIIDKFHVLRMANEAMERVRKGLRERLTPKQKRGLTHDRWVLLKREQELSDKEALHLSGWTRNYDELGIAYRLKEDFFGIYEAKSQDEAQGRYIAWKRGLTPEVAPAFFDLVHAWDNWNPWILGYFDHPITNAYTESLNSLIRVMNRLGRGYSFEALRAKILFSEGAHKHKNSRPKFEWKERQPASNTKAFVMDFEGPIVGFMGVGTMKKTTPSTHPEKNYGADISTLIQLVEAGEL